MDGRSSEVATEVHEILAAMCPTDLVEDLAGVRWSKLLVNASFSGMSAVLGCTFGEVLDDDRAFACAQRIARECIRVADAQGIELAQIWPGVDFKARMDFTTEEERVATCGIYRELWGAVRSGKASMLQDLERGSRSEIDAINGVLSEAGKRYGAPTPVNDTVVDVVRAIECGKRVPSFRNLDRFPIA
jgi:2-dehydropantoate 2-reductase